MFLVFFTWMNNLPISRAIGESVWLYAVIQAFHLVALSVFAGAILIVDLRLIGTGLTERPVGQVAREAQPWVIWGFLGLLVTGIPQLMQNALREYYSDFFWLKMVCMALAIILMMTVRRKVTLGDEDRVAPMKARLVGVVSILLWAGVAIPARLIGLFS